MTRAHHVPTKSVLIMVLALTLALLTAGCGGEAEPGPATTTGGGAASTGGAAPTAPSPPAAATPAADVEEIRVTVTDGEVSPRPSVHRVRLGQTVRLTVTVDEPDEVHLHGYDRELKVAPGKPATMEFRADQRGRFEVETHESSLQLLQLQVS